MGLKEDTTNVSKKAAERAEEEKESWKINHSQQRYEKAKDKREEGNEKRGEINKQHTHKKLTNEVKMNI